MAPFVECEPLSPQWYLLVARVIAGQNLIFIDKHALVIFSAMIAIMPRPVGRG